jgi:hypothetical protein
VYLISRAEDKSLMEGFCKPSGSIKVGKFLDQLRNYQLCNSGLHSGVSFLDICIHTTLILEGNIK